MRSGARGTGHPAPPAVAQAWAAVIVSAVELGILFYLMSKRIKGLFDKKFLSAIGRMLSAAGFMTLVTYVSVTLLPLAADDQRFFDSFPKFVIIVAVSFITYGVLSHILKLQEVKPIISRIHKILFKRPDTKNDPKSHS